MVLAAAINGAPAATPFCVEAGTYPISETGEVQAGDVVKGKPGLTVRRGPAIDSEQVAHVLKHRVFPACSTSPAVIAVWSGWISRAVLTERVIRPKRAKLAKIGEKPPIDAQNAGQEWQEKLDSAEPGSPSSTCKCTTAGPSASAA